MILGREVCVGVAFLRGRPPVADEIGVQAPADGGANGRVDTQVGRRSDNENRCNAVLGQEISRLGLKEAAGRTLRRLRSGSRGGSDELRRPSRIDGARPAPARGLPPLLPADQIFFALTAVTRAEPVQRDGTPWFLGTGL